MQNEIVVAANPDLDDCLTGAAEAYIAEHPELAGWDLAPRWTDEDTRETVTLTVPMAYRIIWNIPGHPEQTQRVDATEETRYSTRGAAEEAAAVQYDIEAANENGALDYTVTEAD